MKADLITQKENIPLDCVQGDALHKITFSLPDEGNHPEH
jgi:hypothetical protein